LTAIGAVNDSMALGVIRAAAAMGIPCPAQLSVVGFDNISWAQLNDPPLTTLDVPKRQMGREAAHRLLSLLSNSDEVTDTPPTQLTITACLIERHSTARLERG
jgi:DNA-binding LacI/PurR family transcriptional regulator